ncbi:MAG: glycoside hydrolase/phage tail family protein [Pseudomonadota bacterium]
MAQIVLSQVGAAAGQALLPQGLSVLGQTVTGAAIGQFAGSLAGRAIDAAMAPDIEAPRIESLRISESREGAGLPLVYGRMRVGGQIIWASRFKENRQESSAGKGGPSYTDYSYSVSFAVALGQGPITRVDRIWANGELLTLADVNWRLYKGDEVQLPDPLIEAIEGVEQAPAYRGTAYIVFEDLSLDAFGNRLPQLSFEVVRAGEGRPDQLRGLVEGVNIIPASGEFVYGTQVVRERRFPGIETPLNMNNHDGRSDFSVSVDQLQADLPEVASAALTVAWFGDDLRAGECRLRPGVETRERSTVPYQWSVDGVNRDTAYLISSTDGNSNFGGTPADQAVLQGLEALKVDGIKVTMSPFLLMDIPAGNGQPDLYGDSEQAAFPWRGRITVLSDGTASARDEIDSFVGQDGGFGFRHFILHHARLAALAGGVDAFLVGSEMVSLTRVRDDQDRFPFVEALIEIASEVRTILGPEVKISYAADWTEYGAYVPPDGSGDVWFPLDPFWAHAVVDFVGVDWYPPAGDWRDGDTHLDALAGYEAADSADYLISNFGGGEGYDWYYASDADRDAQVRTPIVDTAHGEHWVFRQKDLQAWWGQAHHERPGGVRQSEPTDWIGGTKPVRLIEIGFPAVDRGGNAPNLFFDPKSSESAFPPYSQGLRDDLYQRRALAAALSYWQAQSLVEDVLVWAWDGRPWPNFPSQEDVWSDGPNWAYGHWLNGRSGLIELSEVIEDLASRAGLAVDVSRLEGFIEGFVQPGVTSVRQVLSPLELAFDLSSVERESVLVFQHRGGGALAHVEQNEWVDGEFALTRRLIENPPGLMQLSYISGDEGYPPGLVEARQEGSDPRDSLRLSIPLVLSEARAQSLASRLLSVSRDTETCTVAMGPESSIWEADDRLSLAGDSDWVIAEVGNQGAIRSFELLPNYSIGERVRATIPAAGEAVNSVFSAPELVLIDGIHLPDSVSGLIVAASSDPWPGAVSLRSGADATSMTERALIELPAFIGEVIFDFAEGPIGRWDKAAQLEIRLPDAALASLERIAVLNGAGLIMVEGETGWELLAFQHAVLTGPDQWRLSGLLRGLQGTSPTQSGIGKRVVLADAQVLTVPISDSDYGLELLWQAGGGPLVLFTFEGKSDLPWRVGHLRAKSAPSGQLLSWTRRSAAISDSWYQAEATNLARFRIEGVSAGSVVFSEDIETAEWLLTTAIDEVRVAEIGSDFRLGPWASIPL